MKNCADCFSSHKYLHDRASQTSKGSFPRADKLTNISTQRASLNSWKLKDLINANKEYQIANRILP